MSSRVFLDSGAIYALTDRNDADHAMVSAVYTRQTRSFVTHELILVETFSLLTKRLHKAAALQAVGALRRSQRVEVVRLDTELLEAAWLRCQRFDDKE